MSKIDPAISAAFSIAFTKNELEKQEIRFEQRLNEFVASVEGPRGPQGARGEKGDVGPAGVQGPQGIQGERGPKGDKGDRGDKGDKGDTGAVGATGAKGERGETGAQGLQGSQGISGPAGVDGKDGAQGPRGERGEKGDKGDKGNTGDIGPVGPQGIQGERGVAGPKGAKGAKGDKGDIGPQGLRGEKGDTGEKGDKGDAAPDITPKFEQLLDDFNKRIQLFEQEANKRVDKRLTGLRDIAGTSGGGSYKLLDNADVDKTRLSSIVGDSILVYNPQKKKFVVESFLNVLDRIKAELEVQYNKLIDVSGVYTYVGEALPGTGTSEAKWRIKRIEELGDDYNILWANGTSDFDKVWNDRATFTYS